MSTDEILIKMGEMEKSINRIAAKVWSYSEDMLLQFPTNSGEMLVQAGDTITPIDRSINRKLRVITVSIPTNGVMRVYNNNIQILYFSDESGTIELPNGIMVDDLVVTLSNAGTEPARFNYRLIFGE